MLSHRHKKHKRARGEGGRERERERERQTDRQIDRQTDRQRHRETQRERETETERDTERDRDRERDKDRETDRKRVTDRQADIQTGREKRQKTNRQRRLRQEEDEESPDRHVLTITINFNFDSNSTDGDHHAPGRVFFIAGCNNPTPTPYTQKPWHQTSKHSYNPTPSTQKPYGTRQQGTAIIHLYRRLPLILSPHWHHRFVKTIESQKTLALGVSRHQYLERTSLFQIPKESASNHKKLCAPPSLSRALPGNAGREGGGSGGGGGTELK